MRDVILIPAYQPDKNLVTLVEKLAENDVGILVVNDGSDKEYHKYFDIISSKAVIINLEKNRGKGVALKTGMKNISVYFPDCKNFITADADGQHTVEDILKVKNELNMGSTFVLTERRINLSCPIPFRSQVGNKLSRYVYTILTGHYFADNQSGLRGFSVEHIDWLTKVGGDKYDYEMNMLYYADKQSISITTLSIETVYIDNNRCSHFEPVADTIRIYKRLFATAWVTFASVIIIEILMLLVSLFVGYDYLHITIPAVSIISALFIIIFNKFVVFRNVKYKDGIRTMIYVAMRFISYLTGCLLFKLGLSIVPIFWAFNLIAIVMIPLEYLMHKAINVVRYNDIKRR